MLFIVNGLFIQKKAAKFPSWGSVGFFRFEPAYSKNTIFGDYITNQQEVAK
jgi:hypothetical protein